MVLDVGYGLQVILVCSLGGGWCCACLLLFSLTLGLLFSSGFLVAYSLLVALT